MQNAPFVEVIELYADLRRMQIRELEGQKRTAKKKSNIIRRRASDDAGWW